MPDLYIYICMYMTSSVPMRKHPGITVGPSGGILAGCRHLDGHAELACGGRHAPIERDQGRFEAPGNREMQRVGYAQGEIEFPNKRSGQPNISSAHFRLPSHRGAPHVEIGQACCPVTCLEAARSNQPRDAEATSAAAKSLTHTSW